MGLLDNITQKDYYEGTDLGSYQFVSLEDIINQFMFIYVGEEKVISKVSRTDVAFWAQRALAELSFDTFKSIKAQQIDLPPSLTMILPHDYVNYTQLSWVDAAGIKRPLYSTNDTSNPFQVLQTSDGDYDFLMESNLINNNDFSDGANSLAEWIQSLQSYVSSGANYGTGTVADGGIFQYSTYVPGTPYITSGVDNNELFFKHSPRGANDGIYGTAQAVWQLIDVSGIDYVSIEATAETTATSSSQVTNSSSVAVSSVASWIVEQNNYYASDNGTAGAGQNGVTAVGSTINVTIPTTTVRVGLSTTPGANVTSMSNFNGDDYPTANGTTDIFDIGYIQWTAGEFGLKSQEGIDVSAYDQVYILITSIAPWTDLNWGNNLGDIFVKTTVDNVSVQSQVGSNQLSHSGQVSSTWSSYKSITPSENNNDDYEDETYWPNQGERYGLDPQHAQINGSFYIDDLRGKINFSSNISGKTVILDYISDSLGTDGEMQVHKFAEDAMYKHILCGVMSSRANIGRGQLAYYKKDKFASTRQAKLRLSSIKFKDITQTLRGKSKQIKH